MVYGVAIFPEVVEMPGEMGYLEIPINAVPASRAAITPIEGRPQSTAKFL
jgi:hypothetical protein